MKMKMNKILNYLKYKLLDKGLRISNSNNFNLNNNFINNNNNSNKTSNSININNEFKYYAIIT